MNPDEDQSLELDETGRLDAVRPPKGLRELVLRAAGKEAKRVDWALVERAGQRRIGVPTRITTPATIARGDEPGPEKTACIARRIRVCIDRYRREDP